MRDELKALLEGEGALLSVVWRETPDRMKSALETIPPEYFSDFKIMSAWETMKASVSETGCLDYLWCLSQAMNTPGFDVLVDTFTDAKTAGYYGSEWQHSKEGLDKIKARQKIGEVAASIVFAAGDETHYDEFLEELKKSNEPPQTKTTKQHLKDFATMLTGRMTGDFKGVNTGFPMWDEATAGLQPGRLNVVAARPKMGKTALLIQWALGIAEQGNHVGYVTTEMSAAEIVARILEQMIGIPARVIQTGRLSEMQLMDVVAALQRLSGGTLTLLEKIGAEPKQIVAAVNSVHKQNPLAALFIDQLQGIKFDPRRRVFAIGDATKEFRTLGARLNFPVVLACQLSREVDRNEGRRPTLASLRDSGEIEQDADTVTFLWRPDTNTSERELILAANRFGPPMKASLHCDFKRCKFTEVSRDGEPTD